MKLTANVGSADRIVRLILGLALIVMTLTGTIGAHRQAPLAGNRLREVLPGLCDIWHQDLPDRLTKQSRNLDPSAHTAKLVEPAEFNGASPCPVRRPRHRKTCHLRVSIVLETGILALDRRGRHG